MKHFGIGLIVAAIVFAISAFQMDTTVESGGETFGSGEFELTVPKSRVHNIGLMEERRNYLLGSGLAALAGVLLLGFGSLSPKPSAGAERTCPYCAEQIKRDARICRFCNRDLAALETPSQEGAARTAVVAPAEVARVTCPKCGVVDSIPKAQAHNPNAYKAFRATESTFFTSMVFKCRGCDHKFRFRA